MTLEQALARIAELEAENALLKTENYMLGQPQRYAICDEKTSFPHNLLNRLEDLYLPDGVAVRISAIREVYSRWVIRIPVASDDYNCNFEMCLAEFDTEEEAEEAYTKARLNLENGRASQ